MTQLNTSFPRGSEVLFEFQNEDISGGGKDGGRKGVGFAIRRRANRGSINIKE